MRTTLDLDDDVLASAKEIARRENKTAGQVLSDLARQALTQGAAARSASSKPLAGAARPAAHGFLPFDARGAVVTNDLVNRLRDEGAY